MGLGLDVPFDSPQLKGSMYQTCDIWDIGTVGHRTCTASSFIFVRCSGDKFSAKISSTVFSFFFIVGFGGNGWAFSSSSVWLWFQEGWKYFRQVCGRLCKVAGGCRSSTGRSLSGIHKTIVASSLLRHIHTQRPWENGAQSSMEQNTFELDDTGPFLSFIGFPASFPVQQPKVLLIIKFLQGVKITPLYKYTSACTHRSIVQCAMSTLSLMTNWRPDVFTSNKCFSIHKTQLLRRTSNWLVYHPERIKMILFKNRLSISRYLTNHSRPEFTES